MAVMSARRFSVTLILSAVFGLAQKSASSTPEEEIRRVATEYINGVRLGDRAKVEAVATHKARNTSPGGIAQIALGVPLPSWKRRSNLIRRVEVLGPNTGVVIGVWRDFDAAPPFDTGTFHYTLTREQGFWKIAYSHESFLPAPRNVSSVPDGTPERGPDGWETLFDGRTMNSWLSTDWGEESQPSWRINDGCLVAIAGGPRASLITRRQYLFFELHFEWLAVAKTNSGVKYRLFGFDRIGRRSREAMGFEYQIADDEGDPGARIDPKQKSGALYSVTPVERSAAKPLGEWNEARIIVTAAQVEHWLNGTLTARYATDIPFASAIALQHHTTEVRFRNISIQSLDAVSRQP